MLFTKCGATGCIGVDLPRISVYFLAKTISRTLGIPSRNQFYLLSSHKAGAVPAVYV